MVVHIGWLFVTAFILILGAGGLMMVAYQEGHKDGAADKNINLDMAYSRGYAEGFRQGKQEMLKELREAKLISMEEYDVLFGESR